MCFCFYSFICGTSQPRLRHPTHLTHCLAFLLVSQLISLIRGLFSSPSLHIQSNIPPGPRAEFSQRLKASATGN